MVAQLRQTKNQHKRHGHHQKRTRHFLKVYSPYIPLTIIVVTGLVFSTYWQPRTRHGVLAYATSMSVSDLLSSTNQDREANGEVDLNLNSQLESAAQTKANDMVARDYWSHNTPDGVPPWTFITNAGYNYETAGENLAYGFMTSSDTVTGWMNSPEHRANMLNSGYIDVGFGFANSPNFVGSGPETVVVAEYASPQVAAAPAPVASSTPKTPAANATTPAPTTVAQTPTTTPTPTTTATPPKAAVATTKPASTTPQTAVKEPSTERISRLQAVAGASAPWLASMISIIVASSLVALFLKHGLALRKAMLKSERYVMHHMIFDVTILSLLALCFIISRTAGFIR